MGRKSRPDRRNIALPDQGDEEMHPSRASGIAEGEQHAINQAAMAGQSLPEDEYEAISDALTALMHYAQEQGHDVDDIVGTARDHYDYEQENSSG